MCGDSALWLEDLRLVGSGTPLRVEPLYIRNTCDGTTQVAGTDIFLRPSTGEEVTTLSRALGCGPARIVVAAGDASRARAPWLPDGWLDVALRTEGEAFVLRLRADSVPKNIELFREASRALGAARGTVPPHQGPKS